MVFTGLSIQIARFHTQSRGVLCMRENTYAGTLDENGRGACMREGAYGQDSTV